MKNLTQIKELITKINTDLYAAQSYEIEKINKELEEGVFCNEIPLLVGHGNLSFQRFKLTYLQDKNIFRLQTTQSGLTISDSFVNELNILKKLQTKLQALVND